MTFEQALEAFKAEFQGDDGFSVDLRQPSTIADALLAAMKIARNARAEYRQAVRQVLRVRD